jgi:hypothetical protein
MLTGLTVRAQILADKPTVQPEQPEQQPRSIQASSSSTPDAPPSTSGCPFLAAVNPPVVRIPWLTRLQQLTKPYEFQQLLLDDALKEGHKMVALDKTFGFADAYMPASGEAVKTVFAGEAGTDPIIKQSSLPSMGEGELSRSGQTPLSAQQEWAHIPLPAAASMWNCT